MTARQRLRAALSRRSRSGSDREFSLAAVLITLCLVIGVFGAVAAPLLSLLVQP
ncbi:hypothetical protein [Streptomyces sp. GZWMJZ-114]|uniref:hypothetical protein n=1 Tax=Streptomyces sp. GZWMJZ-114 TaxID=2494734 RepID=UPI0013E95CA8|nr:hypothetical protein [Streptomyces sp. GZWMJZ-114]